MLAPSPGPSPPSASTPGWPGTLGSGCRCRIDQNSLVQPLFATSSLLYVHFHDCSIHLKSSHSGRSSSRGTFLLHLGCCQSGKGGKITNTKSEKETKLTGDSQLFQNGEVSQDYSGLARLNSFQPRQTFWWQNVSCFPALFPQNSIKTSLCSRAPAVQGSGSARSVTWPWGTSLRSWRSRTPLL